MVLTTTEKDDIMTSPEEKEKQDDRGSSNLQASGLRATEFRELEGESPRIREKVLSEGLPENEEKRNIGKLPQSQGESLPEIRTKSHRAGNVGRRGLESGDPTGDIGERERLEPSSSNDTILETDEDVGLNLGATAKFDANLLAIRTLKDIESENRKATPEERRILARYSGFGDSQFSAAFRGYWGRGSESWEKRSKELRALTTDEEYRAIEGSRLNAFYTTPVVVKAMWSGLERLGINNINHPHILEPSAGSGRFLGYQPVELASRSQRTAVELDQLTGKMLKHLYPNAEVYVTGFEFAPLPKDSFDIAISNIPFGNYEVFDRSFKRGRAKLTKQIHNYFFAKTIERLRPNGVLAFITTHGTLDAPTHKDVRTMLAEEAEFLGAIRLPKGTFPDTEVCTDIIFMRKKSSDSPPGDKSWIETQQVILKAGEKGDYQYNVNVDINKYFLDHPEMVLGEHSVKGSMRRDNEYTVEPREFEDLSVSIARAIDELPQNIIQDMSPLPPRSIFQESAITEKEGARVIDEQGVIRIKRNGMLEKGDYNTNEANRIKGMLKVRDSARAVLAVQLGNGTDKELSESQDNLNKIYDDFVTQYGTLKNGANASLMHRDPDEPFLQALEKAKPRKEADIEEWKELVKASALNADKKNKLKMPIFKDRTIHGLGRGIISNEDDALSYCYNELGRVDLDRMAELLDKSPDAIITNLSSRGLVYKNPVGNWETADEYLSGDVRDKLKLAETAASANASYRSNVKALQKVQPVDLKPSEISINLGVPWIPASDVNRFAGEICGVSRWNERGNYFVYTPETGVWKPVTRIDGDNTAMKIQWGIDEMPANKIIERILNGKLVEVKRKETNEEGKEIEVRVPDKTIAAQEKAKAIEQKFSEWIWQDEERATRLLKVYNETFNNMRPRRFDGSHQSLPGLTEAWYKKIHKFQKDAIWRIVQDRTALLAHEVGFGKTAVMVASGMELRRLGLSQKNLYVVPKPTHGQFLEQFMDYYPYANILFPSEDNFTGEKRPEFISRIATGDWDAVILTYDQFRRIPLRPETEAKFIQEEIDSFSAALYSLKQAGEQKESGYRWHGHGRSEEEKAKGKTQKEIEKAIKNLTVKLQTTMAKIGDVNDKTIYFDDLGVDQLYIDEADNFKNLHFATQMGRIKGLPNSDSNRAWDLYSKCRALQAQGKGHGVVFATGTPVANTIAEMFTMMRYLQGDMLETKGLQHFDAWAKTFGQTTESLEQTAAGTYRMTQRFSKFSNAPELSQMWQQAADIRVADEVPEIVRLRPRIVDNEGKPRRTIIAIQSDAALEAYMKKLIERADNMKNVDPHEDNMLKLSSDARKAALDVRMVNPSAPGNPNGKVAVAAKNITKVYRETEEDKGTQLVFLDIGTPKAKEKVSDTEEIAGVEKEGEEEETREELRVLRNVYNIIRDSLIANGIPKDKIAFIHDAKTKEQKRNLFDNVNSGQVRVVIGSTGKLGTGVNVQERAAALHHLDAPWRPRDIEQREGRVVRQGNKVYGAKFDKEGNIINSGKGVKIFTYVTERSFDAFMWQAIEAKNKAIKSIMRRDNPPRNIEDIDSFTLSAAEAKALASGNPDVMKAVVLKNAITRLQMLQASYLDSKVRANRQIEKLPATIQQLSSSLLNLEKDANKSQVKDWKFAITIQGTPFGKWTEAAEALMKAISSTPVEIDADKASKIATYKGFDIKVQNAGATAGYTLIITNPDTGNTYVFDSIPYNELTTGVLTRVEKKINVTIPRELDKTKDDLERNKRNLVGYGKQASAIFGYATQLEGMEKELNRLERKLQGQQVEDTPSDTYTPLTEEEMVPGYRFAAKEPEVLPPPQVVVEINPKAEIQALKQEIEPVEKKLEVKKPTEQQLANTLSAIAKMAEKKGAKETLAAAATVPISEIRRRQEERTTRAKVSDWSKQHSIVTSPKSSHTSTWMKQPGTMDIRGIDTASRTKVSAERRRVKHLKPKQIHKRPIRTHIHVPKKPVKRTHSVSIPK